jgi:hypothetical protein
MLQQGMRHQQQEVASIQELIEAYKEKPLHVCVNKKLACGAATTTGTRMVTYHGMFACGEVEVPQFHCASCVRHFDMPAVAAG